MSDTLKAGYIYYHTDARPRVPASTYRAAGYTIDPKYAAGDFPDAYAADVLQPGSVHLVK